MPNQTVLVPFIGGQDLSAGLYELEDDVLIEAASSVTNLSLQNNLYEATFTLSPVGKYRIVIFIPNDNILPPPATHVAVGYFYVELTGEEKTYNVYDMVLLGDEALADIANINFDTSTLVQMLEMIQNTLNDIENGLITEDEIQQAIIIGLKNITVKPETKVFGGGCNDKSVWQISGSQDKSVKTMKRIDK